MLSFMYGSFPSNYVLGRSEGMHDMGPIRWQLCLCLLLAWIVVFLCIIKGVKSSGKVNLILIFQIISTLPSTFISISFGYTYMEGIPGGDKGDTSPRFCQICPLICSLKHFLSIFPSKILKLYWLLVRRLDTGSESRRAKISRTKYKTVEASIVLRCQESNLGGGLPYFEDMLCKALKTPIQLTRHPRTQGPQTPVVLSSFWSKKT